MSDTQLTCDVAVIGAGTAGLAAERSARKNGASTLLIDPEFNGTMCANVGCMPSKLLIAAGRTAQTIEKAGTFGLKAVPAVVDGAAVLERVRRERDRFARLTRESIEKIPPDVLIKSRVRFMAPDRLVLDDGRMVDAKAIVIATGSTPIIPGAFEGLSERLLTNETVFELTDLPRRLAVVGAGPLGLELAQAFAHLGVEVGIFDRADRLAGVRCDKVHEALRAIVSRDLSLHLGVDLNVEPSSDTVGLSWSGASTGSDVYDQILLAVGRAPNLSKLDLEKAGLKTNEHGVPIHNRATMRCGDSAIFLAGDVAGDLPLLHEASHDGAIAGRNAAALPADIRTERYVPFSIMFTEPALATIGKSEQDGAITASVDFSDQGRARVDGLNEGCLTLYAAAPDGKLIGADLVAPAGEHLAHLLAWAIQQHLTATNLLNMPFYHPTIEEGLRQALRTIYAATPIKLPADQDSGNPSGG